MTLSPVLQRVVAGATLLPAAAISLPAAAMVLDHPEGRENWIIPAQMGGMAALGAGLGALLPQAFTSTASHGRAALIGAGAAIGAAALADAAFFVLLGANG